MSSGNFRLQREIYGAHFTIGQLYLDGVHFGFTCEDTDRKLEAGGVKIPRETAIPKGLYLLTTSMSNRFSRLMPEIKAVPRFSGVRIHGGNTDRDTEGCPLLGTLRTEKGVANCKEVNALLIKTIVECEARGIQCTIEVK